MSPTPANLDAMQQHLDLVRHVLEFGDRKTSRTGVDTISVFGGHHRVDLAEGYPGPTSRGALTRRGTQPLPAAARPLCSTR